MLISHSEEKKEFADPAAEALAAQERHEPGGAHEAELLDVAALATCPRRRSEAECDARQIAVPRTAAGKPKETLDSLKGKLLSFNHGVSVMPRLAPRDEAAGRA